MEIFGVRRMKYSELGRLVNLGGLGWALEFKGHIPEYLSVKPGDEIQVQWETLGGGPILKTGKIILDEDGQFCVQDLKNPGSRVKIPYQKTEDLNKSPKDACQNACRLVLRG